MMKNWALLIGGVVREVTNLDPKGRFHKNLPWVEVPPEVKEGWTQAGGKFHAPPSIPVDPPVPAVLSCSPAQGLVALFVLKGIKEADILAFIESIEDQVQRYTAQVAYSHATEWNKQSATVKLLADAFSLSDADLDQLFGHAVTVQL